VRKLLSSLFCLTLLLVPARARALSTTTTFAVFVDGGPAGTLRFVLDSAIPAAACRYVAAWQSENGLLTAQCAVDEEIWAGQQSCVESAFTPIDGILESIGGQGCTGFDDNDRASSVFLLMLGEGADGELAGVIQYSAASSIPATFEAIADAEP
jgi:hypothetical protein